MLLQIILGNQNHELGRFRAQLGPPLGDLILSFLLSFQPETGKQPNRQLTEGLGELCFR